MRIVLATEADWPAARQIRLRSLAADPTAYASTLQRELELPSEVWQDRLRTSSWFLAVPEDSADPVGVALIRPLPTDQDADQEINAMWVAPELRGHRLGEALLDAAVTAAVAAGARTVRLWVTVGNEAATALYTRYGFRPTGRAEPLRSDGQLSCAEYLLTVD